MEHDFVCTNSKQQWGAANDLRLRSRIGNMAGPIRRSLDYQNIARRTFLVEQLPTGALPIYDTDIDVSSVVLDNSFEFEHDQIIARSDGRVGSKEEVFNYLTPRKVIFPTFKVTDTPSINLSDIKSRRYSLIDRAIARSTSQSILEAEDEEIFKKLDELGSGNNDI